MEQELGRFGRERQKFLEEHFPAVVRSMRAHGEYETHLVEMDEEAESEYQQLRSEGEQGLTMSAPYEEVEAVKRAAHMNATSQVMRSHVLSLPMPT